MRYLNLDYKIGILSNHIQGRPTGKFIENHILKLLANLGFNVKDYHGQAYNDATVMSKKTKGHHQ